MPADKTTAEDVLAALRQKHAGDDWAYLEQIPNGTGGNKSRTCDAMAVGCWQRTGFEVHGFEVKVSRSDWLKEIQDPTKAVAFQQHCHRWWIVAAPKIVKLEEMPAEWGLMELVGEKLKVRKAASTLVPVRMSFEFVAGLLRKALKESPSRERLSAEFRAGEAAQRKRTEKMTRPLVSGSEEQELKRLRESLAEFEKRSGISIKEYCGGILGAEFKAFQTFRANRTDIRSLEYTASNARKYAEAADALRHVLQGEH